MYSAYTKAENTRQFTYSLYPQTTHLITHILIVNYYCPVDSCSPPPSPISTTIWNTLKDFYICTPALSRQISKEFGTKISSSCKIASLCAL